MSPILRPLIATLVFVLGAASSLAAVRETVVFAAVDSNGLQGHAANSVRTANLTGDYVLGRINVSGTLTSVNSNTFASDAYIRVTAPDGTSTTLRPFPVQGQFGSFAYSGSFVVPGVTTAVGVWTFRFYEAVDNGGPTAVDSRWDITFGFTDEAPAPPAFSDLGVITAAGASIPETPLNSAGYLLYKLTLNRSIGAGLGNYLDIAANTPSGRDTEIVLFDAAGAVVSADDDSGPGLAAQLSFGTPGRPAIGDGLGFDGQSGALSAGEYYLAVGNYDLTLTDQPWGLAFSGGQTSMALAITSDVDVGIECPDVAVQPVGSVAPVGAGVVLKSKMTGAGLSYRWTRGGVDVIDGTRVFGAATSTLVILAAGSSDSQEYRLRATNSCGTILSEPAYVNVVCQSDFDGDGDFGTDADIEAFFACLGGDCCVTCGASDFNADGDFGTDADIEAFFRVLAGGAC